MSKNNISFILHKPQLSENIGACARAIKNFDFNKLVWPTFPLSRQEIRLLEPGLNHQEENNLLYKSEEFWVKNDFKNSNKDLLNFVTKLSK